MADLITTILSLVSAAIPLIILILTNFSGRTKIMAEPLDSPPLKILLIQRDLLDKVVLSEIDRSARGTRNFYATLYFSYIIASIILFLIFVHSSIILKLIFISSMLFFSIVYWLLAFGLRVKTYNAKIHSFKSAKVIIESEFPYLFNKCHEVLRKMKFDLVKLDIRKHILRASRSIPFHRDDELIVIIRTDQNIANSHFICLKHKKKTIRTIVEFEGSRPTFFRVRKEKDSEYLLRTSRITKDFINLLISKPKGAD